MVLNTNKMCLEFPDGRFYSELLMKTSSTSKPMLLIPLVNKYEIDDYLYPSKINSSKISNCKHRAQIKGKKYLRVGLNHLV